MNGIDLLLGLIVIAGTWVGWRRGLLASGTDLLALAAGLLFALAVQAPLVAAMTGQGLSLGAWTAPLAFVVSYLVARGVLGMLFGRLLALAAPEVHRHGLNRALGTLPGTVNGLVSATVAAMLLFALPVGDEISDRVQASPTAARLAAPADWLQARLAPIFDPAIQVVMDRLTVRSGPRDSVQLPFRVANAPARPDLEAAMLALVNQARRDQGLRPLQADPEVLPVARAHSRDMFARGYFSHITPQGTDPFDRLRSAGVRFRTAGENLALARTLAMAHQGLLDSPGHRANIMQPLFRRVGIGIVDGGRRGLMITQNFRN